MASENKVQSRARIQAALGELNEALHEAWERGLKPECELARAPIPYDEADDRDGKGPATQFQMALTLR